MRGGRPGTQARAPARRGRAQAGYRRHQAVLHRLQSAPYRLVKRKDKTTHGTLAIYINFITMYKCIHTRNVTCSFYKWHDIRTMTYRTHILVHNRSMDLHSVTLHCINVSPKIRVFGIVLLSSGSQVFKQNIYPCLFI